MTKVDRDFCPAGQVGAGRKSSNVAEHQEDPVEDLTKEQQDLWKDKAINYLGSFKGDATEYCHALLDAISTIRARDKEIESLKAKITRLPD